MASQSIEPADQLCAEIAAGMESELGISVAMALIGHLANHQGGLNAPLKAAVKAQELWSVRLILSVEDSIISASRAIFRSAASIVGDSVVEALVSLERA